MTKFNPDKLSVVFTQGVTYTEPILGRRYTLTHSDITAELFLTIGRLYAYDKITSERDEVLAEWCMINNKYYLNVYLHIDGKGGLASVALRNKIFRRELPLALEAIRYGDDKLFNAHKQLDNADIIVYFQSSVLYYNRIENWGTMDMFKKY